MRCSEVRERLTEYMDGLLKGAEFQAIEEHLQSCPKCRRELEMVRELDTRLRQEVPVLWESIEPSPGFASRLKRIELEPEKASVWRFFDSLQGILQNHRPAMAAGLTVLIAVVLAITIVPGIISQDGDENAEIAKAPAPAVDESTPGLERSLTSVPDDAGNIPRGSSVTVGGEGMPVPGEEPEGVDWEAMKNAEEEIVPPTTEPEPDPTPISEPIEETLCTGSTSHYNESDGGIYDQECPAIRIALGDLEVQEALQGETIWCVQLMTEVDLADYVCSGSTVAIAVEETEPIQPVIYVCVEAGTVTSIRPL